MTAYRPSAKLLEVLAYLREREVAGWADGYTSMVGVSDESDTISRGPAVPAYSRTAGSLRTPGVRR